LKTFCTANPDAEFIPESITAGLLAEWRCEGTEPRIVDIDNRALDRLGYIEENWHELR
jgi:hypothetical protein